MTNNNVKMLSEEEISELKKKSPHRSGVWEIDWGPETFSGSLDVTLTIVAHQESYFILEMCVSPSDEIGKGIKALINATKKELTLPSIILVRDKILADEITPLAGLLGCEIKISKLKVIPQIRRDLRRHFG